VVDGVASPILHVSQLASMLGLEAPPQLEASRLAWDIAAVQAAWVELISPLDFDTLTQPTPSRERSLRNLTVNSFHPFELLPGAFETGEFEWNPDLDEQREAALPDSAAVVGYASRRHRAWQEWLLESEEQLMERNPEVSSPRGPITYGNLLASQRWHVAFHYRQLCTFLAAHGHDVSRSLSLASLADLDLPAEVY
jgi:hypothetical protein